MKKNTKLIFGVIVLIIAGILFLSFANISKPAEYNEPNITRPFLGNENASVVVKEFSDLQCPACSAANTVFIKIREEYKDRVRFEFYHYPLITIHSQAFLAAQGAECAKDQGKFWEFVDLSYENQDNLKRNGLIEFAGDLNLDTNLFTSCLDSKVKEDDIIKDMGIGNNLNVRGTPTFYINDRELANWGYNSFKTALDNELAK
ncbi:thioredoxin domain-containing protein [Candidatus Woesearchaeota archaeon]|nr:thioredoxin domain-containing protein [Candidatus Woesearchaeota archaeon]